MSTPETGASDMWVALCKMLCPECGHELQHHAHKDGCEIERGDHEGDESGPAYALPPCGCNAEELTENGWHDFARALTAIAKAKETRPRSKTEIIHGDARLTAFIDAAEFTDEEAEQIALEQRMLEAEWRHFPDPPDEGQAQ